MYLITLYIQVVMFTELKWIVALLLLAVSIKIQGQLRGLFSF